MQMILPSLQKPITSKTLKKDVAAIRELAQNMDLSRKRYQEEGTVNGQHLRKLLGKLSTDITSLVPTKDGARWYTMDPFSRFWGYTIKFSPGFSGQQRIQIPISKIINPDKTYAGIFVRACDGTLFDHIPTSFVFGIFADDTGLSYLLRHLPLDIRA